MAKPNDLTADRFVERLRERQSDAELRKIQRYFKSDAGDYGEGDEFLGVRMGDVFSLAREFVAMDPAEIEKLLDCPLHEARAGACSVMAKQAARKATSDERRRELAELYLRRHDRINNWDLVDLAARDVIGRHVEVTGTGLLERLARSQSVWERRTAIYATSWFLRKGDPGPTFRVAEMLVRDKDDLVQKAVGGWLREAGKLHVERLRAFLDEHAASMQRTMLRYATEKLEPAERARYRGR